MLMSHWLDDERIASNRVGPPMPEGPITIVPKEVARLTVRFRGAMVLLFGEGAMKPGKYRALIDAKVFPIQSK